MIDAETYSAIAQLQRAYGDLSTRAAWEEIGSILADDVHVTFHTSSGQVFDVEGAKAFADFAAKMTGFVFFEYIPLNFVVFPGEDGTLAGRTYSLEVAEDSEGRWIESYSVYEDRYARVGGEWRFTRRVHHTVKQRITGRDHR